MTSVPRAACRAPRAGRVAGLLLLTLLAACGRRGDPIAPGQRLPGAPGEVALSAPDGVLTLTWAAPGRDLGGRKLDGAAGYAVLRQAWPPGEKPCDSCPEDLAPLGTLDGEERRARQLPETAWPEPSAAAGWTYRYRVRALDARGRPGPASAAATITWSPLPAPAASAEAGDGQAVFTWRQPPLPPGVTPLGTRIYGPDGRRVAEAEPGAGQALVSGLANGTPAALAVRAAARSPEGWDLESPSAVVPVTPRDETPPLPPSDLVSFADARGVELRWLPAGDEPYAEVLVLRAREGAAFEEVARLPGVATSYLDASAAPGQTYLYSLVALDAVGNRSLPTRESRLRIP